MGSNRNEMPMNSDLTKKLSKEDSTEVNVLFYVPIALRNPVGKECSTIINNKTMM
jgi:hypothetical protein